MRVVQLCCISAVFLLLRVSDAARQKQLRAGQTDNLDSELEKLPRDVILLSGGRTDYIQNILSGGVPTEGKDREMKLGPGLYNTVFGSAPHNWTKDAALGTWRNHIWRADVVWSQSLQNLPVVLVMRLLDGARFAVMPRTLWYGDMLTWRNVPAKMRCLSEFDALLIPYTDRAKMRRARDRHCEELYEFMNNRASQTCEPLAPADVARLASNGCIQELKLNPGREAMIDLEAVAMHNDFGDTLALNFQIGSATKQQMAAVTSWLAHPQPSKHQQATVHACNRALASWARGEPREKCGKFCDEADEMMERVAGEARSKMDGGDRRWRAKYNLPWVFLGDEDKIAYRKLRASLIREVACKAATEGMIDTVKIQRLCGNATLPSDDDALSICRWL